MQRFLILFLCISVVSNLDTCMARGYNQNPYVVNTFSTSSYGRVDVDMSLKFGVDYISEINMNSPEYLVLKGVPISTGIAWELSYSQKGKVFPLKIGADAAVSHAVYGNRKDYGIVKGVVIDRLPIRLYFKLNTPFVMGGGLYDSILLRGKVNDNDNIYMSILDDRCIEQSVHGFFLFFGVKYGRWSYQIDMSFGSRSQFDSQSIAELNRTHAEVAKDFSIGLKLNYIIWSTYSPNRKGVSFRNTKLRYPYGPNWQ